MQTVATSATRRFTAHEYEQMIAIGVFRDGERVELLDGEVIKMAAMGLVHINCIANSTYIISPHITPNLRLDVHLPILLSDASEPEPDLVVYRHRKRRTPPTPADILLVMEIADSSLVHDRDRKFPRYAEAGIPKPGSSTYRPTCSNATPPSTAGATARW